MKNPLTNQLVVLLNGRVVGTVASQNGRLSFTYTEQWTEDPDAYPLSLSMPLTAVRHGQSSIEPFLWGLLADNARVLERLAQRYQVSAKNVFRLLSHVGEDCAGAIQLVRPERLEQLIEPGTPKEVEWLSEQDIAARLRALRNDPSAGRTARDTGQFSLAGAQPKTAFLYERKRWGVPSGRTPTTHILKPPTGAFDGHVENEHYCLQLARALGMTVPNSRIERFGEEIAIVVERYDRRRHGQTWSRIHQEDLCQALGLHPDRKYEADGGPGVRAIGELLSNQSSSPGKDVASFAEALVFNWLIAGTDAHAKNYSLLLGARGGVRLAPFYDLASMLPYSTLELRRVKLAMRMGGEYLVRNIGLRHWQRVAVELHLQPETLIDGILLMASALPDHAAAVLAQMERDGLTHPTLTKLTQQLQQRAPHCLALVGR
jgi:serine/threonine-protein kinase HipA